MNNTPFENLVKTKNLAQKDLGSVPQETRPGWESRIEEAKEQLPAMMANYAKKAFPEYFSAVTLTGEPEKVEQVKKIVTDNGGIVVGDDYYRRFYYSMDTSFSTDTTFRTNHYALMNAFLRNECDRLGVALKDVDYQEKHCQNPVGIIAHFKSILETVYGSSLVMAHIKNKIINTVVEKNLGETRIPVVFIDSGEGNIGYCHGLVQNLSEVNVDTISDINEQTVGQLFKFKKATKETVAKSKSAVSQSR